MDNQLQNLENIRNNNGDDQHVIRLLEMRGNREEIVNSSFFKRGIEPYITNTGDPGKESSEMSISNI